MRASFSLLICAVGLLAWTGSNSAQDKTAAQFVDVAALDKAVNEGLREVINNGAKVFNEQGDYHGCVRLYQGGLLAVKPMLAHRPDLQKMLDEGLAKANEIPKVVDRAFALRKVVDDVRVAVRGATPPATKTEEPAKKAPAKVIEPKKEPAKDTVEPKKETPKPTVEKKEPKKEAPVEKKVEPKKVETVEKKPPVEAKKEPAVAKKEKVELRKEDGIQGSVRFLSKPVTSGYIIFAEKGTNRTFSTFIRPDGTYHFRHEIPAGSYTVSFEAAPTEPGVAPAAFEVPELYRSVTTSPLAAEVRPGRNVFAFLLLGKGL